MNTPDFKDAVRFVAAGRDDIHSSFVVRRAIDIALEAHKEQRRASGEAYVHHPLAVAKFLACQGADAAIVAAGVAHDLIEDTAITPDELANALGRRVADIVRLVTKPTPDDEPPIIAIAPLIEHDSDDVVLDAFATKVADRLHNLLTIGALSQWRQVRMARETLETISPTAERLYMQYAPDLRSLAEAVLAEYQLPLAA